MRLSEQLKQDHDCGDFGYGPFEIDEAHIKAARELLKMKLQFKTEPKIGHLVAESNTVKYRTYWISEKSWIYVSVVTAAFDPIIDRPMPFLSVDDAVEWCEKEDLK